MMFEELWKLLRKERIQRDRFYRLAILSYQFGDTAKAVVYKEYYGDEGIHAELRLALADVIAQIHVFCLSENLDFEVIEDLGLKRLGEFVAKRMSKETQTK